MARPSFSPLSSPRSWLSSASATATLSGAIVCYFASSVFLTFYQKKMMREHHFPASIVAAHVILKFALASLCREGLECVDGRPRVVLSWRMFLSKVALVGVFSAIDIVFSQWSLQYITITLYTLTKTTSVLWLLGFAVILRLEKLDWTLVAIIVMIAVGLFMFLYHYTEFHLFGFLLVLAAAIVSGIRWTFCQTVMQRSQLGLENPLDFIFHIQPVMLITILPFVGFNEGLELSASEEAFRYHEFGHVAYFIAIITFGGVIAFVMELFEFLIVFKSSGLSLSVVGAVKEIFTVILDTAIHGGDFSLINKIGIVVCLSGVVLHVRRKMAHSKSGGSGDKSKTSPRSGTGRSRRDRGGGKGDDFAGMSLLENDEFSSSEDEEIYHSGNSIGKAGVRNGSAVSAMHRSSSAAAIAGKRFREPDDDFYLKERREWRSTRDLHLAAAAETAEGGGPEEDDQVPVVLREVTVQKKKKKEVLVPELELSDSE